MKPASSNPAVSASQYGAAQAVRAGQSGIMPKRVATELIEQTPARKRRQFAAELAARRAARGNPKRGRNQEPSAEQLTEAFHGRPAETVTVLTETVAERQEFADLGRLVELVVEVAGQLWTLPFRSNVRVCAAPHGRDLYFAGGDQELDLEALGLAELLPRDRLPIGPVVSITYHSSKAFHNFEPMDYVHEFGEQSGVEPVLFYDTLNGSLYLEGGTYEVRPEGIVD
jgi:hypothetical protein